MAERKRATTPKGGAAAPMENDFSADEVAEFFDRLDEINNRKNADVASANSDMSGVYDSMAEKFSIDKEAANFLWARHNAEIRFENRAKKGDVKTRRAFERFAKACEGTPLGDWASQAAGQIPEVAKSSTTRSTAPAPASAKGEKTDAEADADADKVKA